MPRAGSPVQPSPSPEQLRRDVERLAPWFHDLELPGGVRTAPAHPLGSFLRELWKVIEPHLPHDLSGWSALDIGCNGGFYSQALRRRGARVTGIDHDEAYLAQARFAAEANELDIDFRQLDVYDVDHLGESFDLVLFMGVFYHLRHPLYALEKVARLPRQLLVFQTMVRGPAPGGPVPDDIDIEDREQFERPGFPAMYMVEKRLAGDPTNWWVPNEAGAEAMLRTAGLRVAGHPAPEVWICTPAAAG